MDGSNEVEDYGLPNGARVAVVGGGACGAATASSLLQAARSRGKHLEVTVFEGAPGPAPAGAPVILTPECRARLAALGCRLSDAWRAVDLEGVEVIAHGQQERFGAAPGGLWVVDDLEAGRGGSQLLARALSAAAALEGARFIPRSVERVERVPPLHNPKAKPGQLAREAGAELVVRSHGRAERFHAAILAAGSGADLGDQFFPGFRSPPRVSAAHARLLYPSSPRIRSKVARLILSPIAGVDGLYLIPGHRSVHALAFGPGANQSTLCRALMIAACDGHLVAGFEIAGVRLSHLPQGIGLNLTAPGQLAVGPAALGQPLQLGLAEALSSCTRGAFALVDAGGDGFALRRRYVQEGIFDLLEDALAGGRALAWLLKAKSRAPNAIVRARKREPTNAPYSGGVLGLSAPSPQALLSSARWAAIRQAARSFVFHDPEPAAPSIGTDPGLFYVVDDDPEVREGLTDYLTDQGARVVAFSDELSLYAAVAQRRPAAIILDVVLNWVDGLALCEGLKSHPLTRDTRVYVMSGLDRPHIRARAMAAGATLFLPKPFDPAHLWAALTGELPRGDEAGSEPTPRAQDDGVNAASSA